MEKGDPGLFLRLVLFSEDLCGVVEGVEVVGQLVNVGADPVGCAVGVGAFHHGVKAGYVHHEFLLHGACGYAGPEGSGVLCAGLSGVALQNGAHADDGVQDVRAGISFEGGEFFNIENIVLGGLVGQVAVLEGGQGHLTGGLSGLLSRDLGIGADLGEHLRIDVRDQGLQTHNTALAGLKGLAVLAVHGAETDVDKLCVRADKAGFSCRAENLCEVQLLALVSDVDDLVGMIVLHAFLDGREVCCRIEGGAVGLEDDTGRDLLGVCLFCDVDDQCSLALVGIAALLHIFDHARDHGMDTGFTLPEVKGYIQVLVVAFHVRHGDRDDLLP